MNKGDFIQKKDKKKKREGDEEEQEEEKESQGKIIKSSISWYGIHEKRTRFTFNWIYRRKSKTRT